MPNEATRMIGFRLPEALARQLEQEAKDHGTSLSAVVQSIIMERFESSESHRPQFPEHALPVQLERYLNHIIFELVRTRVSLFYIAENRIAPEEELKEIYDTAAESGRDYLEELEKHMAKAAAAAAENAPESSAGPAAKER